MKFRNKELILDNFRVVLKDCSVDLQDVVRSAILDGVDISEYISSCKNNPYRLDQIRLAIKDGLSEVFLKIDRGDVIYKVRRLKEKGIKLIQIEEQLKKGILSERYMSYLIKWVENGLNTSGLDLALIPSELLDTFEYGLKNGFNMKPFNNGIAYNSEYVMSCLQIQGNRKGVSAFLNGDYSLEVLRILSSFSKMSDSKWVCLMDNIDGDIDVERLNRLIELVKQGIAIDKLQQKENGEYLYPCECLDIVQSAFLAKLDVQKLILETRDPEAMRKLANEMELNSRKNTGFRLKK